MPSSTNDILDLSSMPRQAKKEILNYYQFLLERYGHKKKRTASISTQLPEGFYHPVKVKRYIPVSRDEIYGDE
jgi:hypothetical protein